MLDNDSLFAVYWFLLTPVSYLLELFHQQEAQAGKIGDDD